MDEFTVRSVEDHGTWRGRRTWTVHVDGPTGPAQVSVLDVDTTEAAVEQARQTYTARHVFTEDERKALRQANEALQRGLR